MKRLAFSRYFNLLKYVRTLRETLVNCPRAASPTEILVLVEEVRAKTSLQVKAILPICQE